MNDIIDVQEVNKTFKFVIIQIDGKEYSGYVEEVRQ